MPAELLDGRANSFLFRYRDLQRSFTSFFGQLLRDNTTGSSNFLLRAAGWP